MNQILDYNPVDNGSGNRKNGSGGTDKIVKMLAILLIVFAVCIIAIAVVNKIKNSRGENADQNQEQKVEANISTEKDGTKLKVSVNHIKDLDKFVYNWNTDAERNIKIDSSKTDDLKKFETEIDLPTGKNTINIQVVDVDGNITRYSEEIESEVGTDIINPVIRYDDQTNDNELSVVVSDETELDFVTYRWNDEDEVRLTPEDGDDNKVIKFKIPIKEGVNTLTINAVDKAKNTASDMNTYEGKLAPEIEFEGSSDGTKIIVRCKHESGISKIECTFNGELSVYDAEQVGTDELNKVIEFELPLKSGNNQVFVNTTAKDGTTKKAAVQCDYEPQVNTTVQ